MKHFSIPALAITSAFAFSFLNIGIAASAQTVAFNNFGTGDSFDSPRLLEENGCSQGMGFTPAVFGSLDTFTVAIGHYAGTNDAHLFLADGTGGVPGTILESFTLTNLPTDTDAFTPETLTSVLHPLLMPGTTYYLYEQETGDEVNLWHIDDTAVWGAVGNPGAGWGCITSIDNRPYFTQSNEVSPALRVTVLASAVPEPGSMAALLGLSLSGAVLLRRKRVR